MIPYIYQHNTGKKREMDRFQDTYEEPIFDDNRWTDDEMSFPVDLLDMGNVCGSEIIDEYFADDMEISARYSVHESGVAYLYGESIEIFDVLEENGRKTFVPWSTETILDRIPHKEDLFSLIRCVISEKDASIQDWMQ